MAIIIKSLADSQLTATGSPSSPLVYQAPSSPVARTAVVRNIRLANADASVPAAVKVECQTASDSRDTAGSPVPVRRVAPVDLAIPPHGMVVLEREITLGTGDKVQVTLLPPASGTAKLDVVISGIERQV